MENISNTKLEILRSCVKTKTWTEIIDLTGLAKPTVKSHIDRLVEEDLLEKITNGYKTTAKGIEQFSLDPHRRAYASMNKTPSEVYRMIDQAIFPGLTLAERMKGLFAMGMLRNVKGVKNVRQFLDDISKAMRDSVVVWLPKGLEFDKDAYKAVNQLIAKQIASVQKFDDKGKIRIVIDFDLPLALDSVINNEKDNEIKKKLTENRDEILKTLYNNWAKITK